jgi:HYR domain/Secretion system C-terminal sorting domain
MRNLILLLVGIFSITLSFATNPLVPNDDPDPCYHDKEAPHISCSKDVYAYADCGEKCEKVWFDEPEARDNCDPHPKVWCEYQSGYCFPVGKTEVWCWARDKSGNEAKTYFNVIVKERPDKEAPHIYCPRDIIAYAECDEPCAKVTFDLPTAKDNCDPNPKIRVENQSGSCFEGGTKEIWCWAKDKSGNESMCSFKITVLARPDKEAPHIECPKDIVAEIDCRESCANVTFDLPKAWDNCDHYPKVWCENQSGECFYPGTKEVWCWAKDKSGNESKCSFKITVKQVDKTPPVLSNCPKDMILYVDCGLPCTRLDWWMNPDVKDDCDPNPRVWCEVNGKEVDKWYCFPVGQTTVTCYAQDKSGNKSYCSYVIDTRFKDDFEKPTITCPKDVMYSLSDEQTKLNKMCRTIDLPKPTVKDNCDPNPKVVCTVYMGEKDVEIDDKFCFMLGKTRVTCTATDKAGNKSSCGFWVTIMAYGDLVRTINETTTSTAFSNKGNIGAEKTSSETELNSTVSNIPATRTVLRKDVAIYPNPTNSFINLELQQYDGKNVTVQILNSFGQQVYNTTFKEVSDQTYRIDMQTYPTGIYFIKTAADGVESVVKKLMKQ